VAVVVTYFGHATVAVDIGATRLLTDPLLRGAVGPLRRVPPGPEAAQRPEVVLLSHRHSDHLDRRSIESLGASLRVLAPPDAASKVERWGGHDVTAVEAGDTVELDGIRVTVTRAEHGRAGTRSRETVQAVGYLIRGGGKEIYFAGDTDLFPAMADLAGSIDLALLPVWGWGPRLGSGHLDPERAAIAASLLRPRIAVPIHFGVLAPMGVRHLPLRYLRLPGRWFVERMAELAPEVEVRLLDVGESLDLGAERAGTSP
jgi:L-ascorbate metabolism protein UlaG (beta-lactamase superfamily)